MNILAKFKIDVDAFMKTYGMSKTALGQQALGDPHAIPRWFESNGDPQVSSIERMYSFMKKYAKEREK